jgi:uncharacterized membrane protein YfcA
MPEHLIILLVIGLLAGVLSGLFGIGGGVFIVPALVTALGFSLHEAAGTSLAALLLPVGLFAAITFGKARLLDLRGSTMIALGLMTGVYVGAKLAIFMQADYLKFLYGIFLIFVSYRYIDPINLIKMWMGKKIPVYDENFVKSVKWYKTFLLGLAAGVLSGLFGIGGGVIIVPVLVSLFHYDQRVAAGTSLGALLLPVGLPGVLVFFKAGAFSIFKAAPVALGLFIGAFFGAHIAVRVPSRHLKRAYGVFLLIIGLKYLL